MKKKIKKGAGRLLEFIPSPIFIGWALAGSLFLFGMLIFPSLVWLFILYMTALVVMFVFDVLVTPHPSSFMIKRTMENKASLKEPFTVSFVVQNNSMMSTQVYVKDAIPSSFSFHSRLHASPVSPASSKTLTHAVIPLQRGAFAFGPATLRYASRLGCFFRQVDCNEKEAIVKVYPVLLTEEKVHLLAKKELLFESGVKRSKIFGAGYEFERLREYQPDDEYRRINWKATARMGKPISEEYETERVQNVFLMLDSGRLMASPVGGIPKFDYALRASLALFFTASRKDDRIGFLCFDAEPRQLLPLAKGRNQLLLCMEKLYDLKPRLLAPDFKKAFSFLHQSVKKRSLVIFFTDILSPDTSAGIFYHLQGLQPKHLVLCVLLKDPGILHRAQAPVKNIHDVYGRAVALHFLHERGKAVAMLRHLGCLVLDVACGRVVPSVIQKYLELKAQGKL